MSELFSAAKEDKLKFDFEFIALGTLIFVKHVKQQFKILLNREI